jgi:hypothetical protein
MNGQLPSATYRALRNQGIPCRRLEIDGLTALTVER